MSKFEKHHNSKLFEYLLNHLTTRQKFRTHINHTNFFQPKEKNFSSIVLNNLRRKKVVPAKLKAFEIHKLQYERLILQRKHTFGRVKTLNYALNRSLTSMDDRLFPSINVIAQKELGLKTHIYLLGAKGRNIFVKQLNDGSFMWIHSRGDGIGCEELCLHVVFTLFPSMKFPCKIKLRKTVRIIRLINIQTRKHPSRMCTAGLRWL